MLKGRYGIGWMLIGWLAIVAIMVSAIYMLTPWPGALPVRDSDPAPM